ncbi:MAG: acyl carrier protein [Acidobacteriaceae bacterium]|nr:acyl carrier protein [Acidobacteriaceae bacterium]
MSTPLRKTVTSIVAQIFQMPEDKLSPESSPDDIEAWDSLQHLNLVLALEQEFGVQFAPEEIEELLSIELIAALVEEKCSTCGVIHGR